MVSAIRQSAKAILLRNPILGATRSISAFPKQIFPDRLPVWKKPASRQEKSGLPWHPFSSSLENRPLTSPEEEPVMAEVLSILHQNHSSKFVFKKSYVENHELIFFHFLIRISKVPGAVITFTAQSDEFYEGNRIELFEPEASEILRVGHLLVPGRGDDSPRDVTMMMNFQKKGIYRALLGLMLGARSNIDFAFSIERPKSQS